MIDINSTWAVINADVAEPLHLAAVAIIKAKVCGNKRDADGSAVLENMLEAERELQRAINIYPHRDDRE